MLTKHRDLAAGLFLLLLGLAMLIASWNIPRGAEMNIGADFMPKVVSALLALFGFAVMIQGRAARMERGDGEGAGKGNGKAVVLSLVYLGAYIALLTKVGFVVMTVLYIFFQTTLFAPREKRNLLLFGFVSIAATALVYLVFAKGFKLMLPAGIFG